MLFEIIRPTTNNIAPNPQIVSQSYNPRGTTLK